MRRTPRDDERLSERDLSALRMRIGGRLARGSTHSTIRDFAMSTGLSVEQVRAHLEQLRTEQGLEERPQAPRPWFVMVGLAALATAGIVAYLRSSSASTRQPKKVFSSRTGPSVPPSIRSPKPTTDLPMEPIRFTAVLPPPGVRIELIGDKVDLVGDGGEWKPLPRRTVTRRIGEVLLAMAFQADADSGIVPGNDRTSGPGSRRSRLGTAVYHYTISGWIGTLSGDIRSPTDDPSMVGTDVMSIASDAVRKTHTEADEAGRTDQTVGGDTIIGPPPGYKIRYAGRRLTDLAGPRIAFPPFVMANLRKRLVLSIQDMFVRDLRQSATPWELRGKGQRPPRAGRFTVVTPRGKFEFSVPLPRSGSTLTPAAKQAIQTAADRAAKDMEPINAEALKNDREWSTSFKNPRS